MRATVLYVLYYEYLRQIRNLSKLREKSIRMLSQFTGIRKPEKTYTLNNPPLINWTLTKFREVVFKTSAKFNDHGEEKQYVL